MIKPMPKGEIEVALGKCERCESVKTYLFADDRCLENCEMCDATLTMINRVGA